MARKKVSIKLTKRSLKRLFYCALGVLIVGLGVKIVHFFGDEETKESIERNIVEVINIVRESSLAPNELVFVLDQTIAYIPYIYGTPTVIETDLDTSELILCGTPKSKESLTFLKNKGYFVGYNEARGNPAWVAYKVFKPKYASTPRFPFVVDSRTYSKIDTSDYTRSGYDRGHLAPNNAMNVCYGIEAQKESFLMSNITPQKHKLNAGLWKDLEQRLLYRYTRSYGDIWVVCGPIFDKIPKKIKRKIDIPASFFLIIIDKDENTNSLRTISFIIPHSENLDSPEIYLTSIDEIEEKTGLDFFSNLKDEEQDSLEGKKAKTIW